MVAPGDGLEFNQGPAFERADRVVPGLAEAVRKEYAAQPSKTKPLTPLLRKGEVSFNGKVYEFLFARRGPSKVYLLAVAEVIQGKGISTDDIKHFKGLFG